MVLQSFAGTQHEIPKEQQTRGKRHNCLPSQRCATKMRQEFSLNANEAGQIFRGSILLNETTNAISNTPLCMAGLAPALLVTVGHGRAKPGVSSQSQ